MSFKVCSYNIEHFDDLFESDSQLKVDAESQSKLDAISEVLKKVNPDILGVVEAPDTTKSGTKSTIKRLELFASTYNLPVKKAIMGYVSNYSQELALLYNPDLFKVKWIKSTPDPVKAPPFDGTFTFDTDDDKITELYEFARPPLELEIEKKQDNKKYRLLLAHPKSKGIFKSVDILHWGRESIRSRKKLIAECTWIRRRIEEWLDAGEKVIVMGDINDGPGMDFYEVNYCRSAFEILMGSLFDPKRILNNYIGMPKWTSDGWKPASTRFKDRLTEYYVQVLIDHILLSPDIKIKNKSHKIWNPYIYTKTADWNPFGGAKPTDAEKKMFSTASDHFPVSIEIDE